MSNIKPNELRIGNWVIYERTSHRITQIRDDGYLGSRWKNQSPLEPDYPHHISEIQPIPLTPEILEKAGFTHYSYTGITGEVMTDESWDLNHKDGWLNIETDGSIGIAGNRDAYHWASSGFVCQYVHQLQNLYFALTGEELEINL